MLSKILGFTAIFAVANANFFNDYYNNIFTHNIIRSQVQVQNQYREPAPIYEDPESFAPVAHNTDFNRYNNHQTQGRSNFHYSYSVADPRTGDFKTHHERRNGGAVRGYYNLVQPDGVLRKVEYIADDHNGFNAVVRNFASLPTSFVSNHRYNNH